jgi:peptidoglycan/xylan/chitin deacetylase (PgdA/CDA1 family)
MMTTLAYHKVDDRFELGLTTVKPKTFTRQISELKEHGIELSPTTEDDFTDTLAACITFDDGYDCFYRNVVPILLSVEARATVFPVSDYVGKKNTWDLRLSYRYFQHMNASQLREIAELGFEVGSHSCSHRDLTRLDRESAWHELRNSKIELESLLGCEVNAVSFPFGRCNSAVADLAREAGYKRLFGLGSNASNGVLPRVPVYRIDSPKAVRRKVEMKRYEIMKSDLVHSFAEISALFSIKHRQKVA